MYEGRPTNNQVGNISRTHLSVDDFVYAHLGVAVRQVLTAFARLANFAGFRRAHLSGDVFPEPEHAIRTGVSFLSGYHVLVHLKLKRNGGTKNGVPQGSFLGST